MNPGPKLNTLIAEKVFGHKVVKTVWGKQKQYGCYSIGEPDWYDNAGASELSNPLPAYSEDISDAWLVVERLKDKQFKLEREISFYASFNGIEEISDTAPHAICLAALRALN